MAEHKQQHTVRAAAIRQAKREGKVWAYVVCFVLAYWVVKPWLG